MAVVVQMKHWWCGQVVAWGEYIYTTASWVAVDRLAVNWMNRWPQDCR